MPSKIRTGKSRSNMRSSFRNYHLARQLAYKNEVDGLIEASKTGKMLFDRDSGSGEIPANLAHLVTGRQRRYLALAAAEPEEP